MSDQLQTRVEELLADVDAAGATALSLDDTEEAPAIDDVATRASDLLESSEPQELLAAVGLDTLSDGAEPETIPEAIVKGDPERVEDLNRLLSLSKLADRDDTETIEDAAETVAAAIESDEDTATETDDTTAAKEPSASDAAKEESGTTDDLTEQLRSTVTDRIDSFGEDVSSLQAQLESVTEGVTDDESGSGADATGEDGEADTDQQDAETDDEENDGLFGGGLGGDQEGSIGSSDSSRHSTMAPPPSERADMHAVRRHSTMPKKN